MTALPNNYRDDSSSKRLLPQDPLGQRFLQYFHHGWSFIEAPVPEEGQRPSWRTESRYPIEPRNLWSKYQDPDLLLGLSFGSFTNYLLLDIDRKSANHPERSQSRYQEILGLLEEEAGLCRYIPILSSESGGLHIYYFLPQQLHSFTLASTVKQTLNKVGYQLRDGQLEVYPNPKPWNPAKPINFRSHRLPLQHNSFLLNSDLQPVSNDLETLLNWADWSAQGQDMPTLLTAMEEATLFCQKQFYWKRGKTTAQQFCFDLQEAISQGWTSFGQTNDLLLTFAKYGIIFLALSGEDLVDYMLETSLKSPGYGEFCRHQHEIEKRVRQRARSAENYPYYPYGSQPPERDKTYKEHFYPQESKIIILPQQQLHEETIERITSTVAMLKAEGSLPDGAYQRIQAIRQQSAIAYGVGVSQSTLYKEEYKPLWHPAYEVAEEVGVNPDSSREKYPILPDPWQEEAKAVTPVISIVSESLHHFPLYEGVCLPPAKEEGRCEKSAAFEPVVELIKQPQAEFVFTGLDFLNQSNQAIQSQSLVSAYFPIIQFSLQLNTISYSPFNSFSDKLSDRFSFSVTIDKYFQYPPVAAAQPKKPLIPHKQSLSIAQSLGDTTPSCSQKSSLASPSDRSFSQQPNKPQNQPANKPPNQLPNQLPNLTKQETASEALPPPDQTSPPANPKTLTDPVSFIEPVSEAVDAGDTLENVDVGKTLNTLETCPAPLYSQEQYREAIRFRLQALPRAKRLVKLLCDTQGISLMPQQRQEVERFVWYHLMTKSGSPILEKEAREWFAANKELTAQIRRLSVFWDYLQNLQ
jgi:hypothetical protein